VSQGRGSAALHRLLSVLRPYGALLPLSLYVSFFSKLVAKVLYSLLSTMCSLSVVVLKRSYARKFFATKILKLGFEIFFVPLPRFSKHAVTDDYR
jgi:hypothetical protein